ncbi:MAG TPA: hypothetical protein VML53_01055 [Thermoplasmata archaeon]|nr:hypothetical protein [Thermoplasmata archaeon]
MSSSWSTPMRSRESDLFTHLRHRVVLSIGASVTWISATLLYLAFWAPHFSLLQSIVVAVVSLVILGGVLLSVWISYGLRFLGRWPD